MFSRLRGKSTFKWRQNVDARSDVAIEGTITPAAEPEQFSEQLLWSEDKIISSLNAAHAKKLVTYAFIPMSKFLSISSYISNYYICDSDLY